MSGVSFCAGQDVQAPRETVATTAATVRKRCASEERGFLGTAVMSYAVDFLQFTGFMRFDHADGERRTREGNARRDETVRIIMGRRAPGATAISK